MARTVNGVNGVRLDCTLAVIREATNKAWALGNDKFRDEIEDLLRRRARPLPRGSS